MRKTTPYKYNKGFFSKIQAFCLNSCAKDNYLTLV